MEKTKYSLLKFLYAMVIGIVISVFSMGAATVQAAEPQENAAVAGEETPLTEDTDDSSNAVLFILGGMLLIIIAVVVVVAAVSALMGPIAEEL